MAPSIGPRSLSDHISLLSGSRTALGSIVLLAPDAGQRNGVGAPSVVSYDNFTLTGVSMADHEDQLQRAEAAVSADDVLNLQFTSG